MIKISRRELANYAADQLLAGVSAKKIARQLAAVLVVGKRQNEAELLADDVAYELEVRGKFTMATVTSARHLSPKLRQEITEAVRQAAAVETAKLEEEVDQTVLGGLRIETAAHSWDDTIIRRLNDLRGAA